MCRRGLFSLCIILVLPLVLTAGTAVADDVVAEVENQGTALVFHPVVEFKELILVVTGPCNYIHRQVVRDGAPFFKLSEETIDATYTYELVVIPHISQDIIDVLQNSRKTGDNSEVNALCRQGKLPGPPLTQSGGFVVYKGKIEWDPNAQEEKGKGMQVDMEYNQSPLTVSADSYLSVVAGDQSKAAKDFVINDDLIVDGSACIGFDCVNGESFGFDTIRVKENNLRIKFDDTSTAASFPRNDWQITANDSANGGASKFSIDDISGSRTPFTIEANARSHSLYVDDGGRIGSRTSTPSVEIHTIDGDTPTLRLQQDGSSGFAPQTWDVAGNETNFFIRDVTNGSQLPFRIRPDAPSSSIFIDVDGDVGMGTSSPDGALHIERAGAVKLTLDNTSQKEWSFNSSADGTFRVSDTDAVANVEMELDGDGNLEISGALTTAGGSYPDYVFEPGYQLMPLTDLASFIADNGHLPNIPSADQTEGGKKINMTELQIKVLEKVEELTLYTLAQQETINSQQQIIEELRSRLTALEGTAQ